MRYNEIFTRSQRKISKPRRAFTIVELLVVIVVIGILASLIVVGFGAWRTGVAETEVKSDAKNLSAGMEDARNRSNGYPVFSAGTEFDGSTSTKDIFTASNGVRITYFSGDSARYCIDLHSKVVSDVHLFLDTADDNSEPKSGTCEGGEGAKPIDPNLATEFVPPSNASARVTAITVDPKNGDIYYKVQNSAIYRYSPLSDQLSTIATGFNTDAMVFGGDGKLYIFSGPKGSGTADLMIQSVDIASGAITNAFSTPIRGGGTALYKEGDLLYAAGTYSIYVYNFTSGSAQELYYTSGALFSSGLAVVGSDLYFTRVGYLHKIPKAGGPIETASNLPGTNPGSSGGGLSYRNGKLYTIARMTNTTSIFDYDIATGVWNEFVQNVSYQPAYPSGCISPSDLAIYGPRLVYFSAPPNEWSGCLVPAANVRMYLMPI